MSTLVYGYVSTQPYFLSNNNAYSKLLIPFNESLRISLYFLHFIYLVSATLDINTNRLNMTFIWKFIISSLNKLKKGATTMITLYHFVPILNNLSN